MRLSLTFHQANRMNILILRAMNRKSAIAYFPLTAIVDGINTRNPRESLSDNRRIQLLLLLYLSHC